MKQCNGKELSKTEEIKVEHHSGFMKITILGQEAFDCNKQAIEFVIQQCATHGCKRVVLDVRSFSVFTNIWKDFELAIYLSENGFRHSIHRLAVIYSYKRRVLASFFEMTCQNRDVNLRVFMSDNDAVEWLMR